MAASRPRPSGERRERDARRPGRITGPRRAARRCRRAAWAGAAAAAAAVAHALVASAGRALVLPGGGGARSSRRDLLPAAALLAAAGAPAALAAEAPPLDGRRAPSPAVGPARRPEPLAPGAPTVKTPSGLKYTDVTIGQGDPPPAGAQVTIDYVMAAAAGRFGFSVIDRTKDHEGPFTFKLDDPSIIAGLQEGVSTMRAGGVRRLVIPGALSYTDQSKTPSPSTFVNYQLYKNYFFNPNLPLKPDLIVDVKLFKF